MDDRKRVALFGQITDQFLPALRRLSRGVERNEALAKELEQEILMNLWRALPGFREDSTLKTWMYKVAHNTASRHCKKAIAQPDAIGDEERIVQEASPHLTPEEVAQKTRMRSRMNAHINSLKSLDRQVILLFLEDVSQKEIGEITGLTQANVSTRIHRIKAELVRRLAQ